MNYGAGIGLSVCRFTESYNLKLLSKLTAEQTNRRTDQLHLPAAKIEENIEAEIMEVILTDMLNLYGPEIVSVVRSDVSKEETFRNTLEILGKI